MLRALDWCREEVALHIAPPATFDEWITAAADRLHQAIVDYELASSSTTVTRS